MRNTKFKTLNSKQTQMSKIQNSKQFRTFEFCVSDLFRILDLEFRVSAVLIPLFFISILLLLAGCAAKIEKPISRPPAPTAPLELVSEVRLPSFDDDLDQASLELAMERSLQYYDRRATFLYRYGDKQYTARELKESLLAFRDIIRSPDADELKRKKIGETFDVYRTTGFDKNGTVLFTGYYIFMRKLFKNSKFFLDYRFFLC